MKFKVVLIFIFFFYISITNGNDKILDCNIKSQDTYPITLISTIDGITIGVDTFTGNEIWRYKDKPLLETPKKINNNFLILPNPQDGNLFIYTDNKLKRLPFTIPQLVQFSPIKTNDGIFYTGAKKDVWLSIHFEHGLQNEEINIINDNICPVNKEELIHIGRTEYQLTMKNATNDSSWNVTYYEYSSYFPMDEDEKPLLMYLSKPNSGKILCIDTVSKTIVWEKKFPSVIIDTFHLKKDGLHYAPNRFVGSKTFEAFIKANISDKNMYTALYNTIFSDMSMNEIRYHNYEASLYIGRSYEAMYAIPTYISPIFDKKEIIINELKDKLIGFNGTDNIGVNYVNKNSHMLNVGYYEVPEIYAPELTPILDNLKSKYIFHDTKRLPYLNNGKKIKRKQALQRFKDDFKIVDLIEYKMGDLENFNEVFEQFLNNIFIKKAYIFIPIIVLTILFIIIFMVLSVFKIMKKSNETEISYSINSTKNSNNSDFNTNELENISLLPTSDELEIYENSIVDGYLSIGKLKYNPQIILGRGGDGTVVYKGIFEKRDVAVKRVLSELIKITTREIDMLRESDSHNNVIRYFCSESDRSFKYIALELCDCSLYTYINNKEYRDKLYLDNLEILHQATEGVRHLHHLNVVHRDIKPQNILLSKNFQTGYVRVVISDFGLCKKLKVNCNSISRVSGLAGTDGWMAPETLNNELSVTVAVDIFALGCIYYYVLSDGEHPFGNTIKRQDNIINGYFNLKLISNDDIAVHLIEAMIHKSSIFRPSAISVLNHPMFWSNERKLQFLMDVSDRIEAEKEGSSIIEALEEKNYTVVSRNWRNLISKCVSENLKKFRTYKYDSIRDLLRAIRNKKHHYRELPDEVKESLGELPNGFLNYFTSRFPKLLLHVYRAMKICKYETIFQGYYLNAHSAFFKEPFDHLPDISEEIGDYSNSSLFSNTNNYKIKEERNFNKNINEDEKVKRNRFIKRRRPFISNK
ncbi:Serine/threonine-protein kinase/endoribonuclease IRE1 [Strongyloides ratti]|uniref:non-specific serine/threonine protein kinase n=1 Tax=Strongyloides ratti TaxID=34506 RepID=A0A090LBW7_STRRB|nr:Serine/threonine-protein kinase/endoribonuclease IRE1 [Strongyloides ratti]CEF65035.1 Serine/threonine-protein kinase/endoribonuclease IRE1 [Strongyloides ratti]